MNIIDRYITKLFWGYFIGAMLILIILFLAVDAMSMMVTYKGIAISVMLQYYAYYIPEIFTKMLPVVCLLGGILTISNLNKANELVALFASGMSLIRISVSIFLCVGIISVFGYFVSDRILPKATRIKNYIFYNDIRKEPGLFSMVKTDRIWYRSKNTIFNIKTLGMDGLQANGVTIYFLSDNWDLLEMVTAKTADMNGKFWNLKNGSITLFSPGNSFPLTSQFKTKRIEMPEDGESLKKTGQTSDVLSQEELDYFIRRNREAGLDTLRYEVDYHSKIGFSFAGLVMCLIGIPFCVGKARSGGMVLNLGISLLLVFGYWILYSSALTLGQHGHISPVLAAWSPNIFTAGLGFWFLLSLRR